jgi:YD repeat-containing protein
MLYSGQGDIIEVTDAYGANGLVAKQTTYAGSAVDTATYKYDAAGDVASILYANGGTLATYDTTYDKAGRVTSETDNGGATISYTYDPEGQLVTAGTTTYSFDPSGTTVGDIMGPDNEVLNDGTYTYTYDATGEELTKTNIATGDTWSYGYDNNGHMISAVETSAAVKGTIEESVAYQYDVFGNLIEKDITTPGTGKGEEGSTTSVLEYAMDDRNPAKMGSTGNSEASMPAKGVRGIHACKRCQGIHACKRCQKASMPRKGVRNRFHWVG